MSTDVEPVEAAPVAVDGPQPDADTAVAAVIIDMEKLTLQGKGREATIEPKVELELEAVDDAVESGEATVPSTDVGASVDTHTASISPSSPSSPPIGTPRSEARRSQLPIPAGSRLPRKSSNPSLAPDASSPTSDTHAQHSTTTPQKSKRMSLPTPRLQNPSSLRRPSPSPSRTVASVSPSSPNANSSIGGIGDLKSSSPGTPSRIGMPRSPVSGNRSVSMGTALPRTLQRQAAGGATRRVSGLPTISKIPSRETIRTSPVAAAAAAGTGIPTTPTTPTGVGGIPQPRRVAAVSSVPRAPVSRKTVGTANANANANGTPKKAPAAATPAAGMRTPLRVRSFQGAKPASVTSPGAVTTSPVTPRTMMTGGTSSGGSTSTSAASTPRTASASAATSASSTPSTTTAGKRTLSLRLPIKPRARPPVAAAAAPASTTDDDAETLDKRQRAMASSQALREQIKKARAARRESNATQTTQSQSPATEWPQIVIAGVDDKPKSGEGDDSSNRGSGDDDDNDDDEDDYSDAEHPFGPDAPPKSLPIRPGGILDLTAKNLDNLTVETVGETPAVNVKVLLLQRNSLRAFPDALPMFSMLYTLDLSINGIRGTDYLPPGDAVLSFPYLKTLLAHSNMMTSIQPLFDRLDAPRLNYLDVHGNRLTGYPPGLTRVFGALTTFVASDNRIEEVEVDGLEGLQVLDLMNNCIGRLPPRLGLLEGLRELRVVGNAFKVPRRQVLERSTTEVLEWLRDRIPVEERAGGGGAAKASEEEDGWDMVGREEVKSSMM